MPEEQPNQPEPKKAAARGGKAPAMHWRTLLALYAACVLAPLLTALFTVEAQETDAPSYVYELGKAFGLTAIGLFAFQGILAARIKRIERGWGLDLIMQVHRAMGILAVLYIVLHPTLLALGRDKWELLYSLGQPWYIWTGRAALLLALFQVLSSLFRKLTGLTFEQWRVVHNLIAPALVAAAFVHSGFAGHEIQGWAMRLWWLGLPTVAFAVHFTHRIITSSSMPNTIHRVTKVTRESPDVSTIEFSPAEADEAYDYLPGQFHFVTLRRGRGLPVEEHHFTISSSPTRRDALESTIKASGDFTRTAAQTRRNDLAVIDGPYGTFSYLHHPREKELVFVAGGIGITPLMSMLRHIRDTGGQRKVRLFYANRSEEDIVFHGELLEMEREESEWFRYLPYLTRPSEEWRGRTGRVSAREILETAGEDHRSRGYYVCGPAAMINQTVAGLRKAGVSSKRIHSEAFTLLKSHLPATHRNRRARIMIGFMLAATLAGIGGFAHLRVSEQRAVLEAKAAALAEQREPKTWEVGMTMNLRFDPETLEIRVGDTVKWTNSTPMIHTVTGDPSKVAKPKYAQLPDGAEPFDSGFLKEGETYSKTFDTPGKYVYACLPHQGAGMIGEIVVRQPE